MKLLQKKSKIGDVGGYSQMIKTGTILLNVWVILSQTLKLFVLVGR